MIASEAASMELTAAVRASSTSDRAMALRFQTFEQRLEDSRLERGGVSYERAVPGVQFLM
eukprot:4440319-Amphidinium_carterae.4